MIEVTSQGVVQSRHRFIRFARAVCTNLAPEHVEAHGGFENYRAAKVSFFAYAAKNPAAQFFVNLVSLCIFPFAARPMINAALGFADDDFAKFIEQRRKDLPIYIRSAIQP